MDKDFLLETETAKRLYHEHASRLPIIDYHCHLDPRMVAEDHRFRSVTELWLGGDHYKWRAERANGVHEKYITGTDTSDWEKFEKWAGTIPYTFRNPLYHWTHLELRTAFGINKILNPKTAREIFDECNTLLQQPEFSARGLMRHYKVETICTTDDPTDSLQYHKQVREENFGIKMLPTWRPDKAMAVQNAETYRGYVEKLSAVSGVAINRYADLLEALQKRQDFFAGQGCRLSDHGLNGFPCADFTDSEIEIIFDRVLSGKELGSDEVEKFQTALLLRLCEMNHEKGWAQQFHFGPIRNNNTKMFWQLGADTGFDSIGEFQNAQKIADFLDRLNLNDKLGRTILYTLNPSENTMLATMIGNFQDGSVPGKMQFGAAWWFNDQLDGMTQQMEALSQQGLLSRFVGMLTDSRSFLSYPRHEYFRRLLCNIIGNDVEKGLIPAEEDERICQMVEDISYYNAKNYFNF